MNYLVTGGAGFIGSHITERLVREGHTVRVFDNFSTGKRENLSFDAGLPAPEIHEGDLRDYGAVCRAAAGVDFILHQGALPSVPRSVADPVTTNDVNILGTLHVLQAAREAGVKRVVYASSSSVYGNNPVLPKEEGMPVMPLSPYALSKYAGERYCQIFTDLYGLETVSLRYFNVFGPRQDPSSQYSAVIPKFIRMMRKGLSPVIYGDGLQSRDFTYVANNVSANLLACTAKGVAGKVFNIACGQRYTLLDLVAALNKGLGTDIHPSFEAERAGDVKHSLADIQRAQSEMGFAVVTDFYTGIGLMC